MLRAEIQELANGSALKLEGRFVDEWAEQVRSLVTKVSVPAGLVIDVSDVTCVDLFGEQVLVLFRSIGAVFSAKGNYAEALCERLHLPLQIEQTTPDELIKREALKLEG